MKIEIKTGGKRSVISHLKKNYGLSNAVATIIARRSDESFFVMPWERKELEEIEGEITASKFIKANKDLKTRVIGDYDIDGVMSTFILVDGLRSFGMNVDYYLPKRKTDGYGLNPNIVKKAIEDKVEMLITCDNGICAHESVQIAKENGLKVVVTDHHIPSDTLPNADVICNPHLSKSPEQCGATVAYKIIRHLLDDMPNKYFEAMAFATVGDVMPLLGENRQIVQEGLEMMEQSKWEFLNVLVDLAENPQYASNRITARDIGFTFGPCINAAGRMSDAEIAERLCLCDDKNELVKGVRGLIDLNEQRKELCTVATEEAIQKVNKEDKILVVCLENASDSIVGIIAGRLVEQFYRPAIVLTHMPDGTLKGSCRSTDNYNIYEGLKECEKYLTRFGGHKKAAGLGLEEKNLDTFRREINANCKEIFEKKIVCDIRLAKVKTSVLLVREISTLEPFGEGNPEPIFAKDVVITSLRRCGKENQCILVFCESGDKGIAFDGDEFEENLNSLFGKEKVQKVFDAKDTLSCTLAFRLSESEYNGNSEVSLLILGAK
ncbi:single-stranded-DNA-specific exonuclease RecJ [Eubacterium oxidoreducens]|uniref:Single-stranded-DNA-specific exonuclease RecJ n=1 Tax=Eubacterium oxidoreducens TaxID=1732 RepID=A0A1G6B373_EUBOX|nr:DHH family phosphoesterase [Eubacterium oxidoreducens]SDB14989.1 single-stranded-DNA-specific exonuclease [Eubacterium oxidoreducens]